MRDDIYNKLQENDEIEIYELCQFPLIKAKQQVVAGMNYWIKIDLCDQSYAHVYFYVGFDGVPQLQAIQFPKYINDELILFRDDDIKRKVNFYK